MFVLTFFGRYMQLLFIFKNQNFETTQKDRVGFYPNMLDIKRKGV